MREYTTNYEEFGIECEEGWAKLYKPIIDKIEEYNQHNTEKPIIISQIKEKFGGLRFYADNTTDEIDDMISKAEEDSYHTCEKCGNTEEVGMLIKNGWYTTLCKKCALERLNNSEYPTKNAWFKIDKDVYKYDNNNFILKPKDEV